MYKFEMMTNLAPNTWWLCTCECVLW